MKRTPSQVHHTQTQLDASQQSLRDAFVVAFDDWVADLALNAKALMPKTVSSYRSRALRMADFFAGRRVRLVEIREADVEALISTLLERRNETTSPADPVKAIPNQCARYLTLLESLVVFVCQRAGVEPNHAASRVRFAPKYKPALTRTHKPLPKVLSIEHKAVFVEWFWKRIVDGSWIALRNRALFAVQLGAGLKPGEALTLPLTALCYESAQKAKNFEPWKISVPGNGNFAARDTPLTDYGCHALSAWLQAAHKLGYIRHGDSLVFVNARDHDHLDDSVMQRYFDETLVELHLPPYTPHVLRNTWAATNLAALNPSEHDKIRLFLGLSHKESLEPLKRVLAQKFKVV